MSQMSKWIKVSAIGMAAAVLAAAILRKGFIKANKSHRGQESINRRIV